MADITKIVDKGIAPSERYQTFTQADASAGDLILVQTSLGKSAKTITINAVGAMTVRFNTRRTIFPPPALGDGFANSPNGDIRRFNLAKPQVINDTTQDVVTIGANETFSLTGEIPVRDISIVTAAGDFDIFVA